MLMVQLIAHPIKYGQGVAGTVNLTAQAHPFREKWSS